MKPLHVYDLVKHSEGAEERDTIAAHFNEKDTWAAWSSVISPKLYKVKDKTVNSPKYCVLPAMRYFLSQGISKTQMTRSQSSWFP